MKTLKSPIKFIKKQSSPSTFQDSKILKFKHSKYLNFMFG